VDSVEGTLIGDAGNATVKLPSGKLQISSPFTITENNEVNFVYDITVIKTGNGKYILKPQIGASGADKPFQEVGNSSKGNDQKSGKVKESKFKGTLTANTTDIWEVETEDGTILYIDTSDAAIKGEPAVGLSVIVFGTSTDGINITASKVIMVVEDEEDTEEEDIDQDTET